MASKNSEDLGIPAAICRSLRGKATDFYPRVEDGAKPRTLRTRAMMGEFFIATEGWAEIESGAKLDTAIGLARQSLNEVKAQTEYQDQKAGRLLTITTILSALAGLLFQRFNDAYPVLATWNSVSAAKWLIFVAYVLFIAFVLAVLFGALVTFHATRTRFKYDEEVSDDCIESDKGNDKDKDKEKADEEPRSRLFYTGMLRARPRAWAKSFVESQQTGDRESLVVSSNLPQLYFRDLVGETYLIAAKTADKIRFLIEAQRLFAWALVFLLAWLSMFFVVNFVPSTKPAAEPTLVRLEPGAGAAAPALVRIDQRRPLKVNASVKSQPLPEAADRPGKRNGG
jgi:hypothetical protein